MAGILNFTKEKTTYKVIEIETHLIVAEEVSFDDNDFSGLVASVMQNGILQPVTVRRCGEVYEVISGSRRVCAGKICGLEKIPCIVQETSNRESAIEELVEDIQRQSLNFFDEAEAIQKLITYYGMTQEDTASQLGKAQSTIANKLRLLRLSSEEREIIMKFNLTERHARALLKLASPTDRLEILDKVVKERLNVERTENIIEEYMGVRHEKASYKKRTVAFQNVKAFINTVNKAVENMRSAGIKADTRKIQGEEFIEYRVRIPIHKK
ncbi:MAG: ParB/RepB/Spo0J family partition protein [Ruminococcus sp.]|nr:ParB/RepB/Spo0J family partition protein [Ruminococcus sp.]